jgi:hypothetical protein
VAGIVALAGVLPALTVDPWPWWTAVAGPLAAAAYFLFMMRRYIVRRRIVRRPFPGSWRETLEKCVPFYRRLDERGRRRFEDDVRFFLAEQRISGLRGAPADDRVEVLVASSAAILSHGLPEWEWPNLRDIVIYPGAFDDDYRIGHDKHIIGMVHHQGPIVFSERDLKHGYCVSRDGLNVGLHELAHVMDLGDGRADGIPDGMEWAATAPWVQVMADRLGGLRSRRGPRALRSYAGKNEAEFFAVAVEAFFEQPEKLLARDPELYEMLSAYFRQDPARSDPSAAP